MQPIVQSIVQGGMDIVPTRLKNAVLRIVARSKHRSYYLPQREQQPNTSSHVSTALHQICITNPVLQEGPMTFWLFRLRHQVLSLGELLIFWPGVHLLYRQATPVRETHRRGRA